MIRMKQDTDQVLLRDKVKRLSLLQWGATIMVGWIIDMHV